MAKLFTTKRKVQIDGGREMYEVTKTIKQRYDIKSVEREISNLDASIAKFQEKKIKLQQIYDELNEK